MCDPMQTVRNKDCRERDQMLLKCWLKMNVIIMQKSVKGIIPRNSKCYQRDARVMLEMISITRCKY
jgi:hypothetical protein